MQMGLGLKSAARTAFRHHQRHFCRNRRARLYQRWVDLMTGKSWTDIEAAGAAWEQEVIDA
jgi:3-phenylpropionate/trans-cinnamate dioxygenase alpha subunit